MTDRFITVPDSLELPAAVKVGVDRLHDSTVAGRALLTGADAAAQRSSLGLGTAATASVGDFATAEQGAKADASDVATITLTAPLALTIPAGFPAGQVYRVTLTQDGTGGHTVTYDGQPVTVDTTAGAATTVEFVPASGGGARIVAYPPVAKPLLTTGTTSAEVVKPSGDTRPGVWEYVHNSGTGYLWHILAGSAFAGPAALIALGMDNGNGAGLLIANKASGPGIVINQQATIASPTAYGVKVTGSSTQAPSVRIEQNVSGAADAVQILAFGTTTATQRLLYIGAPTGEAGSIFSGDGRIEWKRPIRVRAESGAVDNYVEVTENSSYPIGSVDGYTSRQVKKGMTLHSPSGGGSSYTFAIETGGSYMNIRTGAAGAFGAAPTYDIIKIQHQKIGFFGATPVARPAAITAPTGGATVDAEARTAIGSLITALKNLGLTA